GPCRSEIVFGKNNSGQGKKAEQQTSATLPRPPRGLPSLRPVPILTTPCHRKILLQKTPTRSGAPSGTVRRWRCTACGSHVGTAALLGSWLHSRDSRFLPDHG